MDLTYFMHGAASYALAPARLATDLTHIAATNPFNPLAYTCAGRTVAASCEMFERSTRTYKKPSFDLGVSETVVWERPFCKLLAFEQADEAAPKVLIIAPMSGHYATLLRGTVAEFLPSHRVFITDWNDAREVPLSAGRFDLDDYIDYLIEMFTLLGPDLHVMAVCQPSIAAIAAVARMEATDRPGLPRSLTIMGGPIDTRRSPTAVNEMAHEKGYQWFEDNCIATVPYFYEGRGRKVYPGFMQLLGFMSMNLDRHVTAHGKLFQNLVEGDGDSAERHRDFYDEYLAVMDLTAEFYLQTIKTGFTDHLLPRGLMTHHGEPVNLTAIRRCAIMAVEGEKDDITGLGQSKAALDLTPNLPEERKAYYVQPGVGHYGIFSGSRYRTEIAPRIKAFMERNGG